MNASLLRVVGMPGSPYSRKLLASLRYRRIPHAFVLRGSRENRGLPEPRVDLLPQLIAPGAGGELEARTDSTPLLRELERSFAERSVIPPDPVLAFVDALIEDFADEWLTKAMFHYRWVYPDDIAQASAILPRWSMTNAPEAQARALGKKFAERQIGRLRVVGSNETTGPLIEESYERLLRLLDARLCETRFVLGSRPGASDFALYGQLTQLAGFDPTPRALALRVAPRVVAWIDVVDDLSGLEPQDADWISRDAIPAALGALLGEIGRVHAPFLLANADAIARGATQVSCAIDGRVFAQQPFPYQAKCLRWLREAHAALSLADREALDAMLAGTGCEALFHA